MLGRQLPQQAPDSRPLPVPSALLHLLPMALPARQHRPQEEHRDLLTCEQISSAEHSLWAKSFNSLWIPLGKAVLIALLLAYTCCARQPALPSIPAPRREPKGHPGTRGQGTGLMLRPAPARSPCAASKPATSQAGAQEPEPTVLAWLSKKFVRLLSPATELHRGAWEAMSH